VHASNPERFQQSFSSIAEKFQIPGHEDPKSNVLVLARQWLEKKDCGKWLMVLDNADDAELFFGKPSPTESHPLDASNNLAQYLPECTHGALLITTRNKQIGVKIASGDGSNVLQVQEMNTSESESLLKSSLANLAANEEEVRTLASRLEQLPLALAQAASFILEYSMSVEGYLELLSESDEALIDLLSQEFETIARDRERSRAVAKTWMISFQQIKEQNPLASELLSMMSFLDRQDITIEILQEYNHLHEDDSRSNVELKRSIGILKNFSLVTEQKNGSLDMHRLVQLVTRSWLDKTEANDWFRRKALVCISNLYPFGEFENREVCRAYLAHALAVLELHVANEDDEVTSRACLLHCVGGYFHLEGLHRQAEEMFREALEIKTNRLGENHSDTLRDMANLAAAFYSQGRYKEAEKLEIQALEARKLSLGETHPDTLRSISNLAATFRSQGRYEEAEKLEIQVLEARKLSLGETHPDTLRSISNLAATFNYQGRYEEAEKLYLQALEAQKLSLGETHPDTLRSISNLAVTFYYQGRYEEAEKLHLQALEARKISLGEAHPDTLRSIASLASTFYGQERYKEAEKLGLQALEARKISLGEAHPETLASMANLAASLYYQGRYEEAEKLYLQALEARKISLGEAHPDTLTSMANLGYTLHTLGHLDAALSLMTTCLDSRKRVLGKDHPDTLDCAKTLEDWGNATQNQ
jgi:tetratricopeptide (TPR) repeat protein